MLLYWSIRKTKAVLVHDLVIQEWLPSGVAQDVKYDFSRPLAVMEQSLPGQGHSSALLCHDEIAPTARGNTGSQFNSQGNKTS